MMNLNLDYDEGIILESEDVTWVSRDDLDLDKFVLTSKNLYCAYEKSNGFFKKPTMELCTLSLSDIKVHNGQSFVQQMKYEGSWCLQIQFRQGTEYFSFSTSPKKIIPQWVAAINNALGTTNQSAPTAPRKGNLFSGAFAGAFAEVADNFKSVIDTASETLGIQTKPVEERTYTSVSQDHIVNPSPQPQPQQSTEPQKHSFCVNCGTRLAPENKFCPNCGSKVGANESRNSSVEEVSHKAAATTVVHGTTEAPPKPANTQRQQEYVGKVFKCPHCGSVVNQSDAVCSGCGFHLSGKQAISSAMDFQQQLLKVEMTRQNKKIGFWDQREALDATDKQIVALIKSYPIPNSIEDIVEFFHMAIGNIDVAKSKKSVFHTDGWDGGSRERAISNAWVGKMQQIYKKAELFFPNEPEFLHIKEAYLSMMKELKL